MIQYLAIFLAISGLVALSPGFALAQSTIAEGPQRTAARRLMTAYPDAVRDIDGNDIIFADSSRLPIDDGRPQKSFDDWLASPDLKDMFSRPYRPDGALPPALNDDPGRARNAAFFVKLYGDCRDGGVTDHLVDVIWLPNKWGKPVKFSSRHGASRALAAVAAELDRLPSTFDADLRPPAGTYNCRTIAGTDQLSAHAYGIAIDISLKRSDYWRWPLRPEGAALVYRNRIPLEIVRIFEAHGFIWGGRWYHYDTMHFEYRPELLVRE